MDEQERLQICYNVALEMQAAGQGWNYDVLERLTRPPIVNPKLRGKLQARFPHRRCGIKSRYKGRAS